MPTYVYECSKCNKVFEVDQRISEDPLKDCDCGGKGTLKRLIQPIAVMFKGGGFHINDYSSSSGSTTESATQTPTAEPTSTPAPEKKPESPKSGDTPS